MIAYDLGTNKLCTELQVPKPMLLVSKSKAMFAHTGVGKTRWVLQANIRMRWNAWQWRAQGLTN